LGKLRIAIRSIAVLFAAPVVFVACATPENRNYSAEAIEARVLDEESGQPLEDVVVVANWLLMRGGLGGRTQIGPLMVLEVVSDAKGRISFPAWGPMPNRTFGFLDHEDPELWFFKAGYRLSRAEPMPDARSGESPSVTGRHARHELLCLRLSRRFRTSFGAIRLGCAFLFRVANAFYSALHNLATA
jgi:hypothetical protein